MPTRHKTAAPKAKAARTKTATAAHHGASDDPKHASSRRAGTRSKVHVETPVDKMPVTAPPAHASVTAPVRAMAMAAPTSAPGALGPLVDSFAAAIDAQGHIVVTAAMLPNCDAKSFIATVPNAHLSLDHASVSHDAASVTLTGLSAGSWQIPAMPGITLSDAQVRIVFTASGASGAMAGAVTVDSLTMGLLHSTILLSGAAKADGSVSLSVSPQNHQTPTVSLADLVAVITANSIANFVVQNVPLFQTIPISGIDLAFGHAAETPVSISLTAQLGSTWTIIDGGLFALNNPAVTVSATRGAKDGKTAFAANLHATTSVGASSFAVTVDLAGSDPLELRVVPAAGQTVPTLLDIASAIGGASLRSAVDSSVNALGLGTIAIDAMRADFSVSTRKLTQVSLDGHLTLGGGRVDLALQMLPDLMFTGTLAKTAAGQPVPTIALNALAAQVLRDSADLPSVLVDQLDLSAYPHLGTYSVKAHTSENWAWDVSGTGAGTTLALQQISFHAERSPQGATGGLQAQLGLSGFAVNLSAEYAKPGAGWLLTGTGANPRGVNVSDLVRDLLAKLGATATGDLVSAVQNLRVANLAATLDTHTKSFTFAADTTTTGQVPLGLKTYNLGFKVALSSDIDATTRKRGLSGHLEADLTIGNALFALNFDFGAASVVSGSWRSADGSTLHFLDIAQAIGINDAVVIPGGLDLGLKSASFDYHVTEKLFTLSAESSIFGDAFMTTATGSDGRWGFVFGVDAPQASHLSSIPGIGGDLHAADFLTFDQASILIASNSFKNFSIPALPKLPPQAKMQADRAIAGRAIAPLASGTKLQLAQGLSFAMEIDFASGSADRRLANLRSIVGGSKLLLQAAIGPSQISFFVELEGKVSIPAGGNGGLALSNPAIRIDVLPMIAFQLSGGIGFSIQGTPVTATARLIISESEAQVAISLAADQKPLPGFPGVKGLHLEQFGVEMGVFFEPPGVDLGIQGKCQIGEVQTLQSDQFAIVLEMIGEVPNILYLSFYIDKLDFGQVVTLFTDRAEPATVKAMEIVKASDLSFHWSENQVVLPDGTVATPGFGFSATIQILSFAAHAELEVGIAQGIHGRAEMSPINLKNILQIKGDGKGISRTFQEIQGQWTEVTNSSIVRQVPALPTRHDMVISAGGPVIEFNALSSPFVHINWNVTLFDLVRQTVDVTITDTGFSFVLTYQLGTIARFDMHCVMASATNFSAGASLSIHLDATIGPIRFLGANVGTLHLVVDVAAGIDIKLDPSQFHLGLSGHFQFEGLSLTMPTVNLTVAPSSLKELPGQALAQIRNSADQIFHDLFSGATRWADMIGRGVVTGVTDMANTLKTAYKVAANDAAQLMRTAKQSADIVAGGLKTAYGLTSDAAAHALRGAGFAANEVASGLKTGFGLTAQGVAVALKGAGFAVNEVGGALRTAFGQTANDVAVALKGANFAANEVAGAMKSVFGQSAQGVATILHGAGFAADQVAGALKAGFGQTAQQAANLLRGAGFAADQVAIGLKTGFGLGANAAATVLRGAGFAVNDVGNALRHGWNSSAHDAAAALKGAGFAVDQVGNFLKGAFSMGPDALKSALEGVGFAGDQVKNFFNGLGGDFKKIFDDVGQTIVTHLDPRHW